MCGGYFYISTRDTLYFHLCFYFVNFSYNTNKTFNYKTWAYGCLYRCVYTCKYMCTPPRVYVYRVVCEMKAVMCFSFYAVRMYHLVNVNITITS